VVLIKRLVQSRDACLFSSCRVSEIATRDMAGIDPNALHRGYHGWSRPLSSMLLPSRCVLDVAGGRQRRDQASLYTTPATISEVVTTRGATEKREGCRSPDLPVAVRAGWPTSLNYYAP
jgi:hypothetical protein